MLADTRNPDIPALTGLRFFAAFFILLAHDCDWNAGFQDFPQVRVYGGLMAMYGMPLFFVLSGFVVHYNYRSLFMDRPLGSAIRAFAVARVARLFPLYFVLLLVAVLSDNFLSYALGRPDILRDAAIFYPTLTQSWFYVLWDGTWMTVKLFPLAWSVSTEAFFYLAYVPLVFILIRPSSWRTALAISASYAICVTAALCVAFDFIDLSGPFYRWLLYVSPYVRVFEFLMGCLAAQTFNVLRARPVTAVEWNIGASALASALAFLLVFGLMRMGLISLHAIDGYVNQLSLNFLFAPAVAVVLFCVSRYKTAFSRFLSRPWLVLLGEASYSIYLVHAWTLRLFNHPAPPLTWIYGIETAARLIVAMAFTLIVAYGTYRVVEVPSRCYLRRILGAPPVRSSLRDEVRPPALVASPQAL